MKHFEFTIAFPDGDAPGWESGNYQEMTIRFKAKSEEEAYKRFEEMKKNSFLCRVLAYDLEVKHFNSEGEQIRKFNAV